MGGEAKVWHLSLFLGTVFTDLDYEMLPLLQTILEKKDMAKQLEMKMNGVLEWILSGDEGGNFTIPSDFLMDEEADLTTEILQNCGLDLEAWKDSHHLPVEQGSMFRTGCLYALEILSV